MKPAAQPRPPQRAAMNGEAERIPQGWRLAKLGDVLRLRKEVVHPRNNPRGPATFVGLEHTESHTGRRIGSLPLEMSELTGRKPRFYRGDIVYGYLRPYLNKVWLAEFDGLCSVDQYVYEVDATQADTEFIVFFMRSPLYLARAPVGLTPGQLPRIRTEEVASVHLDLPPLAEQRRIAARLRGQLAEVAQARAAIEAQLAAAQALPAAHLRAVFNGAAAKEWPHLRLGDAAEIVGGMQKTPDRAPRQFHKQFLTVRNVQHGRLDLSNVERFEVTAAEFERLRLLKGDLLLVEGNGSQSHIGRNALFNEDGDWIHQNHIIRARLNRAILLSEFVSHYLNSTAGRAQLLEKAKTTTGLFTLSTGKIAALQIPAPPLDEQGAIAAKVEAENREAADLATKLTEKLAALDRLPAALLREAFAGTPG